MFLGEKIHKTIFQITIPRGKSLHKVVKPKFKSKKRRKKNKFTRSKSFFYMIYLVNVSNINVT